MGPKMDSLLYAILGSDRQIIKGRGSPFRHACSLISNASFPDSSPSFSLFQRPPSLLPCRNEKPRLRSCKLKSNLTSIRVGRNERKTALETQGDSMRMPNENKVRCYT